MTTPGVVEVRDFSRPVPEPNQVLVEMRYASICGSDVHIVFDGFHNPELLGRPGYPGHEGVGIVVRSENSDVEVGRPVLTVPHGQRGGCFAEYQAVDASHVIMLQDGVDLRRMLLAQQLGTTLFGMKKFLPADTPVERMPQTAAVIGAGSSGLFYLQHLIARGVEVIVADLDKDRLAIAERLGAARTVLEPVESISDVVLDATGGVGADLVIEAAGYDLARAAAVEAARIRGTVGFFGYPESKGNALFPVERSFRKSLTMEWVNGTQSEAGLLSFRAAVEAIDTGTIEVDHCLEKMFDLEDTPAALAAARDHGNGAAKVGIVMPGSDD
ncbi:zinc-binding dehydrogenase [Rhodococcus opacus]|uniref:zinc-binding dehydrogenase n=1 Tax=Rhodococcus opacus TaxID=37919 RepID=UPI00247445F9|nr:zinc-binding dehydrogenase [Rhodococcus opacus]